MKDDELHLRSDGAVNQAREGIGVVVSNGLEVDL
jgi:hypothetical protein